MCGIAGIWNRDGLPVAQQTIDTMTDALAHRGPDGRGTHREGSLALGHRRLKIIDLSEASAQPMWLPDRSVCLVFNGEIHNYLEIGARLRAAGIRLRTSSDTEVLLQAYQFWGLDCFERLNGMWAAVFWHPAQSRLVLSRDRFGIKPLVYSVQGSRFAFASEPKALLQAFPGERAPDTQLMRDFIRGAVPDADAHTFFRNIRSVSPGEVLTVSRDGQQRHVWWRFEPGVEALRGNATQELQDLLSDAVKLRLRSDVPIGVALSGGLDSSVVARTAAASGASPVHCFSLRYADRPAIDESRYVSLVASDPGRYRVHWIMPEPVGLLATMASIIWHHDAPTPIRGRFPQWHVMQEAARHVRVILDGQGADELLGGYPRFVLPFALDRLDPRLPQQRPRAQLARELLELGRTSTGIHRLLPRLVLAALRGNARRAARARISAAGATERDADDDQRMHRFMQSWSVDAQAGPYRSRLNNALWAELRHAGLPELLHAEDAISMAFSLESRLPFLDHRIVELCFSLPFDDKIGDGWTKLLLRHAAQDLPDPVRWRRHKLGFPADYAALLGGPSGLAEVRGLLLDGRTLERGHLERTWLLQTFGRSAERARRWVHAHLMETWSLVSVELWCRLFLDGDTSLVARHRS